MKLAVPALLDFHWSWSSCICAKLMLSRAIDVLPANRLAIEVLVSVINIQRMRSILARPPTCPSNATESM